MMHRNVLAVAVVSLAATVSVGCSTGYRNVSVGKSPATLDVEHEQLVQAQLRNDGRIAEADARLHADQWAVSRGRMAPDGRYAR